MSGRRRAPRDTNVSFLVLSTGPQSRGISNLTAATDLGPVDLLGFSIGSFVAQQIALTRPDIVRKLILASAAPQGAAGMHGWAAEVIGTIGTPETSPEEYLGVFFARSWSSRQARVKLYPDAAHGFLFQHHAEFAADVHAFISDAP
jgi:pimeloyl-ACP methyl ester carboxylesterase